MDVTTTEKRTLHHKVVVNHEPPIIVTRRTDGKSDKTRSFATTQSVYSVRVNYGDSVRYVSVRHSGHNVLKDGSKGAYLRDIFLSYGGYEYDRDRLDRVEEA